MRTWLHKQPMQCDKMVFCVIFGFYLLQQLKTVEAICATQYADFGAKNVQLLFNYSWSGGSKLITCSKNQTIIGQCAGNLVSSCSIEQTSVGVYTITSNTDLTSLSLTVLHVNETTTGTYSCSKPSNTDTQTIILEITPETKKTVPDYTTAVIVLAFTTGLFVALTGILALLLKFPCKKPDPIPSATAIHPMDYITLIDYTLTVTIFGCGDDENGIVYEKLHAIFESVGIVLPSNVFLVNAAKHFHFQNKNIFYQVFTIRFSSPSDKEQLLNQCKHTYKYRFNIGIKEHSVDLVYVEYRYPRLNTGGQSSFMGDTVYPPALMPNNKKKE